VSHVVNYWANFNWPA